MPSPVGTSPCVYREALKKGLDAIGYPHKSQIHLSVDTKNVAVWGWKKGKELRDAGHNVLVLERGYIGDRFNYTSLGWNGLNGFATFPEYPCDDGVRFGAQGGKIKPWRASGGYGLILGQVRGDASLRGQNIQNWYEQTAQQMRDMGMTVYFRAHPHHRGRGYFGIQNAPNILGTLQESLSGAHMTACYNSNSALDSILEGIPCYVGDEGTVAYKLCMKDISKLYKPEREKAVYKYAYYQWDKDEIASGLPLRRLMEMGN